MKLSLDIQLEDKINNNLFTLEEGQVEIELLEDLNPINIMGVSFSGGKKKSKVKLPRYLANWLTINNKAKLVNSDVYIKLLNSLKQQKPSFKLNNIPENLLLSTLNQIGKNSNMIELNPLIKNDTELMKVKETFSNLVTERLKKILRDIAINNYRNIEKDLDSIEKPLIRSISHIVEEYFNIINLGEKNI